MPKTLYLSVLAYGGISVNPYIIFSIVLAVLLLAAVVFCIVNLRRIFRLRIRLHDEEVRANEAIDARNIFISNISHEIKTPINAIIGMNEIILQETEEIQTREYAMDAYTAANSLLTVVNDIFDYSKLEAGNLEVIPGEYSVTDLLYDVVNMTSQRANTKSLNFNVSVNENLPSVLFGDDIRIRQIMVNLLSNAVKYTPKGEVSFKVDYERTPDGIMLFLEVKDTGIGIAEAEIPKLTGAFQKMNKKNYATNIEGTGLGLSITSRLIGMMGGTIDVTSVLNAGSCFTCAIPQGVVSAVPVGNFDEGLERYAGRREHHKLFMAPNARVLTVDDNAINRKVFRGALKNTLIQIDEAESGMQALEMTRANTYDIIFMDHMMPVMDGVETLHAIKEDEGNPCRDVPIVILTANTTSNARANYIAEGFEDFLPKPLAFDALEKMIKRLLPNELLEGAAALTEFAAEEKASTTLLEKIEGFDFEYASLYISDPELLVDTLLDFRRSIDSTMYTLTAQYNDILQCERGSEELTKCMDEYRVSVHSLKGVAATVGALKLSKTAKLLEFAARDGNLARIKRVHPVLIEALPTYKDRLDVLRKDDEKEMTDDPAFILAWLMPLRNAMVEMDFDVVDEMMEKINECRYEDELQSMVDELQTAVTNLDEESVLHSCDEIYKLFNIEED